LIYIHFSTTSYFFKCMAKIKIWYDSSISFCLCVLIVLFFCCLFWVYICTYVFLLFAHGNLMYTPPIYPFLWLITYIINHTIRFYILIHSFLFKYPAYQIIISIYSHNYFDSWYTIFVLMCYRLGNAIGIHSDDNHYTEDLIFFIIWII
jgi:hypothetical protein